MEPVFSFLLSQHRQKQFCGMEQSIPLVELACAKYLTLINLKLTHIFLCGRQFLPPSYSPRVCDECWLRACYRAQARPTHIFPRSERLMQQQLSFLRCKISCLLSEYYLDLRCLCALYWPACEPVARGHLCPPSSLHSPACKQCP